MRLIGKKYRDKLNPQTCATNFCTYFGGNVLPPTNRTTMRSMLIMRVRCGAHKDSNAGAATHCCGTDTQGIEPDNTQSSLISFDLYEHPQCTQCLLKGGKTAIQVVVMDEHEYSSSNIIISKMMSAKVA